ncbi:MAG: hypothetical protein IPM36_09845 [Lewinellaceae bacterium]|nr:hypothetical protein [Lewinellaceae bacterium]
MKVDFDIFDDYLDGKLSPEHAAALEEQLAADAELNKAFELHKRMREALVKRAKARAIADQARERLRAEGFFDQFQKKKRQPVLSNKLAGLLLALLLIIVAGLIGYVRTCNQSSEHKQPRFPEEPGTISPGNPALPRQDSDTVVIKKRRPIAGGSRTEEPLWSLEPVAKKNMFTEFAQAESSTWSKGSRGVDSTHWRYWFVRDKPDYDQAFRLLQQQAADTLRETQRSEYYVLGALCLLHKPNCPSGDAVQYLEKAKGVDRLNHKIYLLTAYLQNQQFIEAKAWAQNSKIPADQWPSGAAQWLK